MQNRMAVESGLNNGRMTLDAFRLMDRLSFQRFFLLHAFEGKGHMYRKKKYRHWWYIESWIAGRRRGGVLELVPGKCRVLISNRV